MRKFFITSLTLFSFSIAKAQEERVHKNALKINPLSLFALTGNVSYERAISRNKTFQLGAFYSGVRLSDLKYNGYGFTPELRFYFAAGKEAFNGLYAAPFARYQSINLMLKETGDRATFDAIGGGAIIGWEKMWNGAFTLDVFAGPAYYDGKLKANIDEDEFNTGLLGNRFTVRAGMAIGWGF